MWKTREREDEVEVYTNVLVETNLSGEDGDVDTSSFSDLFFCVSVVD